MNSYIERLIYWDSAIARLGQKFAKSLKESQFFAVFRKDSETFAVLRNFSQSFAIRRKSSHLSTDHSTENVVKVMWRDRPRCDAH